MPAEDNDSVGTAVLGGGPAGLTAAHVLTLRGERGTVFEADGTVGGIAKTVEFEGYRFDLGGHRFFTKLKPVERMWRDIMGNEFLTRPRLSRIYYNGKFLAYPLEAKDVVKRLGLRESALCALSYFWSMRLRGREAHSFEDWVTVRFGKRLYNAFFRSYTEKVWGIPGSEVRSQWAAQRIKDFSFWRAGPVRAQARPAQDHDPDRGVPVPAARPGPDVGATRGAGQRARRIRADEGASRRDQPCGRPRGEHRHEDERRRELLSGRRRRELACAERSRLLPRPAASAGGPRGRRASCATASSAWSR